MRLIDAFALMESCKDLPYGFRGMVSQKIANAPTVEARRKGTWLALDDCMAVCSECNVLGCGSNYCPFCGADMREAEE